MAASWKLLEASWELFGSVKTVCLTASGFFFIYDCVSGFWWMYEYGRFICTQCMCAMYICIVYVMYPQCLWEKWLFQHFPFQSPNCRKGSRWGFILSLCQPVFVDRVFCVSGCFSLVFVRRIYVPPEPKIGWHKFNIFVW